MTDVIKNEDTELMDEDRLQHDVKMLADNKRSENNDDVYVFNLTMPDCAPVEARTREAE